MRVCAPGKVHGSKGPVWLRRRRLCLCLAHLSLPWPACPQNWSMVEFVKESLDRRRDEVGGGREVEKQRDEIRRLVQASKREVGGNGEGGREMGDIVGRKVGLNEVGVPKRRVVKPLAGICLSQCSALSFQFLLLPPLSPSPLQEEALISNFDISDTLNKELIAWQLKDKMASLKQQGPGIERGGAGRPAEPASERGAGSASPAPRRPSWSGGSGGGGGGAGPSSGASSREGAQQQRPHRGADAHAGAPRGDFPPGGRGWERRGSSAPPQGRGSGMRGPAEGGRGEPGRRGRDGEGGRGSRE